MAVTDISAVFGQVTSLMLRSPSHKHLLLADLEWLVLPALMHGQYRLFKHNGVAVAYASWAFADEETAARICSEKPRLRPADWQSGEEAWLVDLVAPEVAPKVLLEELRVKVFREKPLRCRSAAPKLST